MVMDPVCKMEMEIKDMKATTEFNGKTYYFCHDSCKQKFLANPRKYIAEVEALKLRKAS